MKIIECVPNFSEGRDEKIIKAIVEVFRSYPDVCLADYSWDGDHHRSVFTFLGKADDVLEAALAAAARALDLIDMRHQAGVHPRMGAVDVVPFVPLAAADMQDAVQTAHAFGRRFYERFGVPIYFYGAAALRPSRLHLPDVRRGGYEGLPEKMARADGVPDLGTTTFPARSGATIVGAREILVAFNINLAGSDLALAQKIAAHIRERNGGLKSVRAIGMPLKSRNLTQVSVNLTDCRQTSLKDIFDEVNKLAAEEGVEILESELIGLAPACAFAGATPEYLKLRDFSSNRLIETHLKKWTGLI